MKRLPYQLWSNKHSYQERWSGGPFYLTLISLCLCVSPLFLFHRIFLKFSSVNTLISIFNEGGMIESSSDLAGPSIEEPILPRLDEYDIPKQCWTSYDKSKE